MKAKNKNILPAPKILAKKDSKSVRILLDWRGKMINFGTLTFVENDASLYFSSGFHTDPTLELGVLDTKILPAKLIPTDKKEIVGGMHISLHGKGQVMHVRQNQEGEILYSREIEWYPVTKPFNLLNAFSPPLIRCQSTTRTAGLINKIPDHYEKSVQLKIDIFPRDTEDHFPEKAIWENWGYCPDYLVRISIVLPNVNNPAIILWSSSSELKL